MFTGVAVIKDETYNEVDAVETAEAHLVESCHSVICRLKLDTAPQPSPSIIVV
jgi:hypothetical protein